MSPIKKQQGDGATTPPTPPVPPAAVPPSTAMVPASSDQPISTMAESNPDLANYDGGELLMGRIKLAQGNMDEITQGIVVPGNFMDTVSKHVFGERLRFVALAKMPVFRICWKPRSEGGWHCRSNDARFGDQPRVVTPDGQKEYGECATCRFAGFGSGYPPHEKAPRCVLFMSYLVMVPGQGFPKILSFERSKFVSGQQFATVTADYLLKDKANRLRDLAFEITRVQAEGGGNTYFKVKVSPAGKTTPEEKAVADRMWAEFVPKIGQIKVDLDDDEPENPATTGGGTGGPAPAY